MKRNARPELVLFALAALVVIGSVVLIALGHDVPLFLQGTLLACVTGGAGVAAPQAPVPAPQPALVIDGRPTP